MKAQNVYEQKITRKFVILSLTQTSHVILCSFKSTSIATSYFKGSIQPDTHSIFNDK